MPDPDPTIVNLIIAGDYSTANEALSAGHPDAFLDTIAATVSRSLGKRQVTSVTSVTIGTGTKVFTVDNPQQWAAGMPVYVMEASSPSTRYMAGKVISEVAGVLTVDVQLTAGTGTYASWTIASLFTSLSVASPPMSEAQGGTAAVTFAGGRENMQVPRQIKVVGVDITPPGGPANGAKYLVHGGVAGGAWATHEDAWATWTGAVWTFESPAEGDITFDRSSGVTWRYRTPSAGPAGWYLIASEAQGQPAVEILQFDTTLVAADIEGKGILFVLLEGVMTTLTLPAIGAPTSPKTPLVIINETGHSVTVNSTGGWLIGTAVSRTLTANSVLRVMSVNSITTQKWVTW